MNPVTRSLAASLAPLLFLSACVIGGEELRYRLIAPQVEAPESVENARAGQSLAVARPEADRTRDSSRILVRRDRTLLPWAGAAWIDRSPDLVLDLLVEYLDGRVATVGRYGSLPARNRLDLVMRRFEFVDVGQALQAEIVLVARVFAADGELLDATTLSGSETAGGESIGAAVAAMEIAMEGLFADLAEWLRPRLQAGLPGDGDPNQ